MKILVFVFLFFVVSYGVLFSEIVDSEITATSNGYYAGITMDLDFHLTYSSSDWDYLDGAYLDFPDGVTVNSADDIGNLSFNNETGNGVKVTWGDTTGYSGWGNQDSDADFSVNVSISTEKFSGDMDIDWFLIGDGTGFEPHEVSGTIILSEDAPQAPANPNPSDNGFYIPASSDLLWTNGVGTETVDVYFGTDETKVTNKDESMKVVDNDNVETYDPGTMLYTTEYFWRVIAKNSVKGETDGPVWSFTTAPEGFLQIGNGNQLDTSLPIEPYYNYDYTQTVYLSSNFQGIGSNKRIEKIYYNYRKTTTNDTDEDDWTIWMGTTSDNDLNSGYLDVENMIKVFDGSVGFGSLSTGDGWLEITLNIPFVYDPSSDGNLIIAVHEYHSGNTSSTDDFYCDQDTRANVSRFYSVNYLNPDPYSPPSGSSSSYYPNIRFYYEDVTTSPDFAMCPSIKDFGLVYINQSSMNQQFKIINTGGGTLTITSVSLSGTDSDQFTLTDSNTYPVSLSSGELITVEIAFTPTSIGDKSVNLSIESSAKVTHTASLSGCGFDPYIYSFPYTQNFDSVTPPALPDDWSYLIDNQYLYPSIETYNGVAYSEPNSVCIDNGIDLTDDIILISPPTNLDIHNTRIKFWARGSGAKIRVGTMTDRTDASTFTSLDVIDLSSTYTEYTITILDGNKEGNYIGLQHGQTMDYESIYIDNFSWIQIQSNPVCTIDPADKNFGRIYVGESSSPQTFTIQNTEGGSLEITNVSITGTNSDQFSLTDTHTYPVSLGTDESITVDITFGPTDIGQQIAYLSIDSNVKTTHNAELSGDGYDPNYGGGGTGQGGYYYANSTSGASGAPSQPSYNWIDISTTGNEISATINSDNSVGGPYDIGFTFHYFDTDYTQFWICADGYITFVEETSSEWSNKQIPYDSDPNSMISLLWDDMNPGDTSVSGYHLYYGNSEGTLVITYEKMPEFGADENGWFTGQIILYPNGNIKLQYKEVGSSFDRNGCTVGIENEDGTKGVEYLYNGSGGSIYSGIKEGEIAVMFGKDQGTLPIVLSSFTAQMMNNIPVIHWITESEVDNMGWFVYRNTLPDFTTAQVVSEFIEGYGTTTLQHTYVYEDTLEDPQIGEIYYYWLESFDLDGTLNHYNKVAYLTIPDDYEPPGYIDIPLHYGLYQNFPNPFNPSLSSTRICFYLEKGLNTHVKISIYNLKGEKINTIWDQYTEFDEKPLSAFWNGCDEYGKQQASGVYFYKLETDMTHEIKKMIILN